MRFTEEMLAEDEKRWAARDVVTELGYCGNYMRDRKDMTNLDIRFYAYLMRKAHDMLKKQEPRVMTLTEWTHAPEPADGECMCYEIKGKGLQSMLVKAFDGTRHLYGKAFRVWTVRPTDAQRKAVKWDG